jgi:putative transferase (TIGR04331 family)
MRYLVTTHEKSTWPVNLPITFLNNGCLSVPLSESEKARDYLVLEPAIDGVDARIEKHDYVTELYASLLNDLTDYLNSIHSTTHAKRYWEIGLGLWLSSFLDATFERWGSIANADFGSEEYATRQFLVNAAEICPPVSTQFVSYSQNSAWNHFVFSNICETHPRITTELDPGVANWSYPNLGKPNGQTKSAVLKKLVRQFTQKIGRMNKYVIASTYLPRRSEFRLAIGLFSMPVFWQETKVTDELFNLDLRNSVTFPGSPGSQFEEVVRKIIRQQIPKSFVENYRSTVHALNKSDLPRSPRAIFTSNLHASSDSFTIWAAEKHNGGSAFVIGQHGGLYGQGNPPTRIELHEIGVADKYLTWGWTNGNEHVVAGPALINVGKQSNLNRANRDRILLVTDCTFRYSRRPWSTGALYSQYLDNLFRFVDLLSKSERDALIVRLHHDHDKDDKSHLDQWRDRFPNIEIDPGKRHLDLVRAESRIDICTTIGTSEIESMSNDRPTLIYLDPATHPFRQSVQHVFTVCAEAGILHYSPESLARQISEVWEDIDSWWNRNDVKFARDLYCSNFAQDLSSPIQFLRNEIKTATCR